MLSTKIEGINIKQPYIGKVFIEDDLIICRNSQLTLTLSPNDFLNYESGDIVSIMPDGIISILYRSSWQDLTLFITNQCNSACIMCPQVCDNSGHFLDMNLQILELKPENVKHIGITGGEPTVFPDVVIELLHRVHDIYPDTPVSFLTNGRAFKNMKLVERITSIGHSKLLFCIPLYAANYEQHDYIVGCNGAFIDTIKGIFNLFRKRQLIEIRTVLFSKTIGNIKLLAEYISRNLPFVRHVAIMGMEYSGYAAKNSEEFWIDPFDYKDVLESASLSLYRRGIMTSIYNIPLCLLTEGVRFLARDSISAWKKTYPVSCNNCVMKEQCCGIFETSINISQHISPLL